ncbi:MAG: filamentous hemagglutinin N-terminal domain-containing protein, partial [Cyanobacteria bacterium J06648_11]
MWVGKCLISGVASSVLTIAVGLPCWGEPVPSPTSSTRTTVDPDGLNVLVSGGDRAGQNLYHSFEDFSVPEQMSVEFATPTDVQNIIGRVVGDRISTIDGAIAVTDSNATLFLINPNGILFGENARLNVNGSFVAATADELLFADGLTFGVSEPAAEPLLSTTLPVGVQFGANPGDIQHRSQFALPPPPGGPPFPIPIGLTVAPGATLALVGGHVSVAGAPPDPSSPIPVPSFATFVAPEQGRIDIGSVGGNERVALAKIDVGWQLGYEDVATFRDISLSLASVRSAGTVILQGRHIEIANGSQVTVENLGSDPVGGLQAIASESLTVENAGLFSITGTSGDAGGVMLQADRVRLGQSGQIDSSTQGGGRGGNVTIRARSVVLDGGAPPSGGSRITTNASANGRAGDVTIAAATVELANGGAITSSASPDPFLMSSGVVQSGNGGNITIKAKESVDLVGQTPQMESEDISSPTDSAPVRRVGLFSETLAGARGNGGNIVVRTDRMTVTGGAEISVDADAGSLGRAGSIAIAAESDVSFLGEGSGIFATGLNAELAGSLDVTARRVVVRDGATLSVSNLGSGDAGDLTVDATSLAIAESGQLSAETASGDGGDIAIVL